MKKSPNKISSKKNIDLKIERQALLDRFFLMEYVLVVLIIGIFFLLRKNFVGIPMERDEGSYVMYGKWLIDGGKPYLDFYEMKPPGIFLVYGFMVKFFGYDYMNLQTGFCYLNSLTLLFSYLFFNLAVSEQICSKF